MEQAQAFNSWFWFLVEIAKAVAWPLTVVFAVWWGKPQIVTFFDAIRQRKVEVEAWGFKAKIGAAEQQQATKENPVSQKLAALEPSTRQAVNAIESTLRTLVEAIAANEREARLLRALAETRLQAGHEFTYNRIFGSQIAGLKRLDEIGGTTMDDARQFFQPYADQFPEVYKNYGFDGWLHFLTSNGLVNQSGNRLQVSDFGHDFLVYLREARLSEGKAF